MGGNLTYKSIDIIKDFYNLKRHKNASLNKALKIKRCLISEALILKLILLNI